MNDLNIMFRCKGNHITVHFNMHIPIGSTIQVVSNRFNNHTLSF